MYIAISLIHLFKPLDKKSGGGGRQARKISVRNISVKMFLKYKLYLNQEDQHCYTVEISISKHPGIIV